MSNPLDHISAYPIPPGEFLEEELEVRGVEVDDFAREIGISTHAVMSLLRGEYALTPALADALEAALGSPAHIWLGLEEDYRAALMEQREARAG